MLMIAVVSANAALDGNLASEELDSLLIFTSKDLRFTPFDQQSQRSLKQLRVHAVEIYICIVVSTLSLTHYHHHDQSS